MVHTLAFNFVWVVLTYFLHIITFTFAKIFSLQISKLRNDTILQETTLKNVWQHTHCARYWLTLNVSAKGRKPHKSTSSKLISQYVCQPGVRSKRKRENKNNFFAADWLWNSSCCPPVAVARLRLAGALELSRPRWLWLAVETRSSTSLRVSCGLGPGRGRGSEELTLTSDNQWHGTCPQLQQLHMWVHSDRR